MQPAIILKEKLAGGQPVLGMLVCNHLWMELIEIAIVEGLDYVILDSEHLQHDSERIADACRLGRVANFPVLVRPPTTDADTIRMTADLGSCGMLLPMIETAAQLDEVQQGLHMPPRGRRRPGGPGNRWVRQFNYENFKSVVEDHFIVVPQIESPQGIENVDAIAAHELVTAVGIGPFDLSARLGICFEPGHPKMQQAWASIQRGAEGAGKPMWAIGNGQQLLARGLRFICFGEPTAMLENILHQTVAQLREVGREA